MTVPRSALLLIGSPRGFRSNSSSLGQYLVDQLEIRYAQLVSRSLEHKSTSHKSQVKSEQQPILNSTIDNRQSSFEIKKLHIHALMKSDEGQAQLLKAVDEADLVILSFPLYADSLPAPIIAAMELIAEQRRARESKGKQRMAALCQSGFLEAEHSEVALAICRRFTFEAGFSWAGGLALGGGEVIGRKPLRDGGGVLRNVRKALDLSAEALSEGEDITQEAAGLMARKLMPSWLYVLIGNWNWKRAARKFGTKGRLCDRPYL